MLKSLTLNHTNVNFSMNQYIVSNGGETYPTQSYTFDPTAYRLVGVYYQFKTNRNQYRISAPGDEGAGNGTLYSCTANETVIYNLPASQWSGKTTFASGGDSELRVRFHKAQNNGLNHLYSDIELILDLDPIVSVSSATVATVEVGQPQTVTITNAVTTSYHKVSWTYGSVSSGEVTVDAANRTPTWSVPSDKIATVCALAGGNDTSIQGTVIVKTYSHDGTLIGTTQVTSYLTMTAAQGAPTITAALANIYASNAPTSISTSGKYVQNYTYVRVTPVVHTQYNATAGTVTITTPDGRAITNSGASKDILLLSSGDNYEITLTSTDSRGFTASATYSIAVVSCARPIFTLAEAKRCKSGGTESDEGTYIKASANVIVSSYAADAGSTTIAVSVSEVGSSSVRASQSYTGNSITNRILGSSNLPFEPEKNYAVTFTATDALGLSTSVVTTIGTALYIIHRMAGGHGVAFGKVSELAGTEVAPEWLFYTHGQEIEQLIMDISHPVGSIIQTMDAAFDPNTAWPWTLWGRIEGRFLWAAGNGDSVGDLGGSKQISLDQLPTYTMRFGSGGGQNYLIPQGNFYGISYRDGQDDYMPPYLAVNTWVRIR